MRYLLFAGINYYPSGGLNDAIFCSDSIEDIKSTISENNTRYYNIFISNRKLLSRPYNFDNNNYIEVEWYHIVDINTMSIIEKNGNPYSNRIFI